MREIESIEELKAHIREAGDLRRVALQALDLREHGALIDNRPCDGAIFFGCRFPATLPIERLIDGGATIFPRIEGLPYNPFRARLYSAEELAAGFDSSDEAASQAQTFDARVYRHYVASRDRAGGPPILEAMAQRLHDHAIDDALAELLAAGDRKVVAIMGGHAMRRDDANYRAVALTAQLLAECESRYLLASGGGPGAMEATHLGAYLAGRGERALDEALAILAPAPTYRDAGWTATALQVRERFARGADSVGIPTWFYGHEPPNLFASHVAKYFANSIREEGLLAIAKHGVIYAPGSAGTIQEIFMDAAQNHYATYGAVSPMVFFGERYWCEEKPIFPLLRGLAKGTPWAAMLGLSDDPVEIVAYLQAHPPMPMEAK